MSFKDQLFIIYAERDGDPYKVLRVSKLEAMDYYQQVQDRQFFVYRKPDKFESEAIVPEFFVIAEAKEDASQVLCANSFWEKWEKTEEEEESQLPDD